MAAPTITTLPDAPSRGDPANFNAESEAFVAALATLESDVNAFGSYLNNNSTIVGGELNNTIIGASTPKAGTFTSITGGAEFNLTYAGNSVKFVLEDSANPKDNYIECTSADNLTIAADEADTGANSSIRFRVDAVERVRITDTSVGIGETSPQGALQVSGQSWFGNAAFATTTQMFVRQDADAGTLTVDSNHATQTVATVQITQARVASSLYKAMQVWSNSFTDLIYQIRGDGEITADGSFTGGGADRAEAFEWSDGNPDSEDRTGWTVVIDNGKIRRAAMGETPIGVISVTYDSIGNAAPLKWGQKYLVDDLGRKQFENYSVVEWTDPPVGEGSEGVKHSHQFDQVPDGITPPLDAVTIAHDADGNVLRRQVVNPDYDPAFDYTPRLDRKEWDAVGLLGIVRVLNTEQTAPSWIKLRDISETVSEWFVK